MPSLPISIDKPVSGTHLYNVANYLKQMVGIQPYKKAVVYPDHRDADGRDAYTHLTFQQLEQESDNLAWGLESVGVNRGTRTILMVKPSLDFFILIFSLFKIGAIPVVVDPGMGLKRMVNCFKHSHPEAFIGITKAHTLRALYPRFFKSVKTWITAGRPRFFGSHSLTHLRRFKSAPYPLADMKHHDTAAILFTTGSTGPAKGVIYTHGVFANQIESIKDHYGISPDEIDLPTFPLFALFDPALGMTAVIPDMDPTRPAHVNPSKIINAIESNGVTNMFASPALLHRVGRYGKRKGVKLRSLKRVISAGAPIMPSNIEQFSSMLCGNAKIHTGYGATEAMPVSSIDGYEILSDTRPLSEQGFGVCVGRPLKGVEVRIISITDQAIDTWSEAETLNKDTVGEITVRGNRVTQGYYEQPGADALAKIKDGNACWHRMGDLGRIDSKGRIWFYGRKSQRVITEKGTLYTIPCEAIFNNHPDVYRSALVGVGKAPSQKPVICIELETATKKKNRVELTHELLELARSSDLTKSIETILYPAEFPVDIRHNAKIFREKLAHWAEKKTRMS